MQKGYLVQHGVILCPFIVPIRYRIFNRLQIGPTRTLTHKTEQICSNVAPFLSLWIDGVMPNQEMCEKLISFIDFQYVCSA